jgi:hyperosmotically inducible periplasmic protein
VDIKLEIKGEVPVAQTDQWLIAKVKSALLFHRSVSATETEVLAKDGTVTLRGKAASVAQKNLATKYAKDVEGVKYVKNEMTAQTVATKPGKKSVGEKVDAVTESIDDAP